ncbi:MAG: efflux RND transporter periplasmic adaptor subunit [Planctomycetota bacterium]
MRRITGISVTVLAVAALAAVGLLVADRLRQEGRTGPRTAAPAPVEVGPVTHGPIVLRRTFSGTLEPSAEFVVAPKVGGRIEHLAVDLADRVRRNQVVAELEDGEFLQAVAQAEADLAVAQAKVVEAESALQILERELNRIRGLSDQGIASEAQLDTITKEELAKKAALAVARSQVTRAEAVLESTRIRLGYTKVTAVWSGDDEERVVAQRDVDEGETVSANTPLMTIVALDPIVGVVYVTEKDYGLLSPGQEALLATDASPGRRFRGRIARIAPVFRQSSRQARIELSIANPDGRLKPGMFMRAEVELDRVDDATIVPVEALTRRADVVGVFVVDAAGTTVRWVPVEPGIREAGRVAVTGDGLTGRVVTLGHQLIEDGSRITIPVLDGEAGVR